MKIDLKYWLKHTIDNSDIINGVIESANPGDVIMFPPGKFPIHSPVMVNNRVTLKGNETQIVAGTNTTALMIRGTDIKPIVIDGIDFINAYGLPDSNMNGVFISGIVHFRNSWIKSFGGHGIVITADVITTKTNASFSRFDNLIVSENKGSGLYFQGGDANQCNCYHIDVRDNGGHGIWDHSFLGNQFFGCMAHSNKLSNYCADDLNNRAGFFGCYSEQGSPGEELGGAATWHGGLAANGFKLSNWAKVYINT